ncbi:MAG: 1-acyl-sn-glycerol-3-phosphate acyltransferase [Acidobacteria bacterium]|nr:1-acyl-sn-glycerol-3-phosphate acyltransferase [Acidobacteriota bacterium]
MARSTFFHDLSSLPDRRARLTLRLLVFFLRPLVEIEHLERLHRLPRPAIFAFNHNNAFETLAVPALLIYLRRGRLIHFFVDWMYLRIPLVGWILRQCQPIPVFTKKARWDLWRSYREKQSRRRPVEEALEKLRTGGCVGIFPEGTRNSHLEKLRRGRLGVGELVLGADAPVVPVGIQFKARHRLGRMPVLGRIRLVVGEPMAFRKERRTALELALAPGPDPQPREAALELRRVIVHRVMESLAQVSSKTYPYRSVAEPEASARTPRPVLPADRLEVL